jgi:hypothetical protein
MGIATCSAPPPPGDDEELLTFVTPTLLAAEFFDEGISDKEIESLERMPQTIQSGGQYSSDWPKAGVGRRIAGVTGEKVSFVVDLRCANELVQ